MVRTKLSGDHPVIKKARVESFSDLNPPLNEIEFPFFVGSFGNIQILVLLLILLLSVN